MHLFYDSFTNFMTKNFSLRKPVPSPLNWQKVILVLCVIVPLLQLPCQRRFVNVRTDILHGTQSTESYSVSTPVNIM